MKLKLMILTLHLAGNYKTDSMNKENIVFITDI